LFPEGRLREVIESSTELEAGDDLALLDFVGRDLPGAVVVRSVEEWAGGVSTVEAPAPAADEERSPEEGLRFSLAGVQLKFSMLLRNEKLTLPLKDQSGEWIVKFDSPTFPHLPENEFSMLEWARAVGFDVPECHLHDVDVVVGFPRRYARSGSRVLAIRRYDRLPEGRVHQEDFAQAVGLPPGKKYDQITYELMARLVRAFIDEEAVDELVRRLTFAVASGNGDAHLKNWSLVYPDRIQARWSPLYDQVATIAWEGPDRALALKLAGVKDFGRVDRAAFERFAEKAAVEGRRVLERVDETLEDLRRCWGELAADLPLPPEHREALREHWRKVPLLRDAGPLD
jgi:serine/threonine-protein kinase HipA